MIHEIKNPIRVWNWCRALPVLLILSLSVSGCATKPSDSEKSSPSSTVSQSDKSSPSPIVSQSGDASDRKEDAVAEKDEKFPPPSPEERKRMQDFLNANVPKQGIVKTLQMPSGETIDCVKIEMQPALLKSDMRGHKVQRAPSKYPDLKTAGEQKDEREVKPAVQEYAQLPQPCPVESVPIRRLTIEELTRFQTLGDFLNKHPRRLSGKDELLPEDLPEAGPTDKHQYAVARRYVENWGAESVLNLWKPYTESGKEFTLSQIWVARGDGGNLETVEAGWQKYKNKYGDWRSRLFIYFTPDNYGGGGCYNLDCGAFVQVNNSVYIAGGFTNYSSHDGAQYAIKLLWYKDFEEGHWWLRYGDTWVGYYPRTKFDSNGLRNRGSRVTFGGEITDYRTGGHHTRTDMGSGYMPSYGFAWAAYHRSVRYVDTSNFYRRATELFTIVSDDDCYDIDLNESNGSWEVYFYFGGWGYGSQCE
ncbi:MAG TPA: neprosin family prolyl endopeptidase [Burkholderiales bacterium]|nr:neprosin family prolyl endopeptidase [Burkholderiales bacterium]